MSSPAFMPSLTREDLMRQLTLVAEGKAIVATVQLNGTDKNPYEGIGFSGNPFPAIPVSGFEAANALLSDLASHPIRDLDDLRERLKGCAQELIDICVQNFQKGKIVTFGIAFPR
jgi:hypothetical protein